MSFGPASIMLVVVLGALCVPVVPQRANRLLRKMAEYNIKPSPREHLNKFVNYILAYFHCLQTYTDMSLFANTFLSELNNLEEIKPIILGAEWDDTIACKGFVLIAENYTSARQLLSRIPRYGEHRIALVLRGSTISLTKVTMSDTTIFRDADVVLTSSQDLTTGFIMEQPRRYFSKVPRFKKWPYSSKGPKDWIGREVNMLTYNCSMFSELGPLYRNGTPSWAHGVEIQLFNEIAERLNLVPRYKAIAKRPSTSTHLWYEKDLTSGTDMAFCGIIVSSKKITKNVIMTVPLTQLCLKFIVPRPVKLSSEWDGVFRPFEPELWAVTGLVALAMSFFLQRLTVATRKYTSGESIKKYEQLGVSFIEMLSILVMTNLPRSAPDQRAVRHLLTWWAFFTMILSTCYSSGLVSHLSKHYFSKKPRSIQELVKGNYTWAMATKPDFAELLNLNDTYEVAWRWRFRLVRNRDEHIKLLLRKKQVLWGYVAFEGFSLPNYDLPDYVMNRYEISGPCFMEHFIGYAIREGCPFENAVNSYIQKFNEAGLVRPLFQRVFQERYETHKYVYRVLRRTKVQFTDPTRLQIENLLGIFIVWSVGMALAIVIFFLELAQRWRI